jgi:hypothetical protein
MTQRILVLVTIAAGLALLVSAAQNPAAPQDQDAAAKQEKAREEREAKERDKALKRAALERELPIAREKLIKAQKDLSDQDLDAQGAAVKLQKDLGLAKIKLETFEKREMPAKIAKAQLDLQNSRDGLDNSQEELEQLEIMYKEQDLADKTREIVIRRAKRDLERARQRLGLQEAEATLLTERTLPQDREKLALDVEEKEREIARAERAAQKATLEKRIALMAAESDIKRIEAEMAAFKGEAK